MEMSHPGSKKLDLQAARRNSQQLYPEAGAE